MAVRVWDLGVRLFHWSLAALVLANLILGDEPFALHLWLGYAAGLLVLFRIAWGFLGSPRARFRDFLVGPGKAAAFGGALVRGQVAPHPGHTPLGGYMILALLLTLLAQVASGLLGAYGEHWAEDLHKVLANVLWALIGLHLAGVLLHTWRARENILRPMVTGTKPLPPVLAAQEAPLAPARRLVATAAVVLLAGGLAAQQLGLSDLAARAGEGGGESGESGESGEGGESGESGESGEAGETGEGGEAGG